MRKIILYIVALLCFGVAFGQEQRGGKQGGQGGGEQRVFTFQTDTPKHDYDLLLHTPTENSMGLSLLFYLDCEAYVEYNGNNTKPFKFKRGEPQSVTLSGLEAGTESSYRVHYKVGGNYKATEEHRFRTPSPEITKFNFSITADSHLDENCNTATYLSTLREAAKCNPDFHIDLGDTFMVDKYRNDFRESYPQYLAQRYYFGTLCAATPLNLVIGNHDGETSESRGGMREWAGEQRRRFYPTPYDKNYYSFEWGNTLIVVLDPYSYSDRKSKNAPWLRSLGEEQYWWLEETLKKSKATHKFVFIHNLVGGADIKGSERGGAEVAHLYEWGGKSVDGRYDFTEQRRGWAMPIHQLLKTYGVAAVFHGHDHVYARQEYDGVRYICLSQPGIDQKRMSTRHATEYGYVNGVIQNHPAFLSVEIDGAQATIRCITSSGECSDEVKIMTKIR